ncbi:asparagine synthase (glutamine-hydrolyzing) [Microbulbifer epialgicus]|uniref:asparagine synthase (glutamine-hydrolyzing) n=1 Tax=Microbulbifer epialgicus TaxID=393907 RepID=A0ABV4P5D6_9GAMM
MCGISGLFSPKLETPLGPDDVELLKKMTQSIVHRGPDDEGLYLSRQACFGFRRLSFLDLKAGNQPIFNEDESVVCVVNGEIFNYQSLRRDLIKKGHHFRSEMDCEVIPHLYEEYGIDFLKKLNGQFAIALHDVRAGKLVLARDHVGIAPLYYHFKDNQLLFGSEIKSLLNSEKINRDIDLISLDQIVTFPGMVSPRTIFNDIKCLPPGHLMMVDGQGVKLEQYWDLDYPENNDQGRIYSNDYYVEKLDYLLRRAISTRLHADVPIGFYLSGGLDSSLIATLASDMNPARVFNSFSIGFGRIDIDERKYQQKIVKKIHSNHHEKIFDFEQILQRLTQAVIAAESPIKESYNTCSLALSQMVHQQGIKAVLTGEGADELFAGYVGYRLDQQSRGGEHEFDLEYMLESQARSTLWGDENFFYEKNYHEFHDVKTALYSTDTNAALSKQHCTSQAVIDPIRIANRHHIHQRSYVDFKLRIADHLLADHGDRVVFANSVEARYPFLDIDLINFVRTIPPHLMVQNGSEKFLLKQLARKTVPRSIIERNKFSFVAPGSTFLLKNKPDWIMGLLSRETIIRQGIFNPNTIEQLTNNALRGTHDINQTFETDFLMIAITTGIFLREFVES